HRAPFVGGHRVEPRHHGAILLVECCISYHISARLGLHSSIEKQGAHMSGGITQRTVDANGISFAVLEAGEGPLALCLHGFPDTAESWRPLLGDLAAAGYHAVAPFLRGYAPSGCPADGDVPVGALVSDACALHEALGGDGRAVIIGHDWGAGTA